MRRGRLAVPVIALALAVAVGPAWGQRAGGERQFNQQLNKVRQQVQPHFRDIRGQFANLRAQGINTSGWERQLNQAEAMLNNLRWQPGMGSGQGTGFQSINPFGDFLFSGVPITPAPGGKLVTRHLDPTGLAQRAEEWARALSDPYQLISRAHEMAGDLRAINDQLNARQGAERQKFLADLGHAMALAHIEQRELKAADLGGGGRELKPKGVGEDTSGLPRLQGDTPMLLRDPFGNAGRAPGQPIFDASRPGDLMARMQSDTQAWDRIRGMGSLTTIDVPPPQLVAGRIDFALSDTLLSKAGDAVRVAFPEAVAAVSRNNILDAVNYVSSHSEPQKVSAELSGRFGSGTLALGVTTEADAADKNWNTKVEFARGLATDTMAARAGVKAKADGTAEFAPQGEMNIKTEFVEASLKVTPDKIGEKVVASGVIAPGISAGFGFFVEQNVKTNTFLYGPTGQVKVGAGEYYAKLKVDAGYRWTEKPWITLPDLSLSKATTDLVNHWAGK